MRLLRWIWNKYRWWIEKSFGKRNKLDDDRPFRSKGYRVFYWYGVGFYTIFLIMILAYSAIHPQYIIGFLLMFIILPYFFRFVYSVNLKLNGFEREE